MACEQHAEAAWIEMEGIGLRKPRERMPCNDEVKLEALELVRGIGTRLLARLGSSDRGESIAAHRVHRSRLH